MQLTKTQQQKAKPNHQTREFDKAWQQVQRQKDKNSKLEQKVKKFAEQLLPRLEPAEQQMALTECALTNNLVVLYSRKSLSQWQRDELRDWILENLDRLASNPFTPQQEFAEVKKLALTVFETMHPEMPWEEAEELMEEVEEDIEDEEDLMDDLFGFDDLDLESEPEEPEFEENIFEKFEAERLKMEAKQREENQSLDQLLKKSSINKIFRQLARALHPDRASSEEERLERHHLMSELTVARDAKDIPRLFELYQQHLQESPMELLGDKADLETVTQLLKRQLQSLKRDEEDIIYSDPQAGALFAHFHKRTQKATEKAIQEHLKEIRDLNKGLIHLQSDITSLAKLKPYLEERNEMRMLEHFYGGGFLP